MRIARRIVVALVTGLFLVSISSHLTWAAQGSGGLDPTFGVRGKVLTDFGGGSFESAKALAIQSDGKIVVAGISNAGPRGDFALAGTFRRSGPNPCNAGYLNVLQNGTAPLALDGSRAAVEPRRMRL